MKSPLERLLAKIDIRQDSECWPWKACIGPGGYGRFWLNGKMIGAHRAVVLLLKGEPLTADRKTQRRPYTRGPIGAAREVRHLCNNSNCCNPAHVEYSNHSQNMLDRNAAGNHKSPLQKLTHADYAAIIASSESDAIVAKRFSITRAHVWYVRNGKVAGAREAR